jgi:hypothetical protein
MGAVIVARRGERIVLAEFPKGHVEKVNDRLNGIAAECERDVEEACS